jgi:tripartite-type tricarboxylate transporter receptor subunit TctC
MKRATRRLFCSLLLCVAHPAVVAAEAPWPSKPVHILVPGGAGGVTDIRARWLAAKLSPVIGQPVVVENKPGAAGLIGMEAGARSAPDGYTLVIVHQGTIAVNPHIYARIPYDPRKDFTPVTRLGVGSLVLVVNPALPVKSVNELIALARQKQGQLTFGSPGVGTPPHLAGELFKREAGVQAIHVAYKGGGAAASDLIGGHVDYSIEGLSVMLPHIQAGRVRALAVTGPGRAASLPDVPTMREAGLAEYVYEGWVGIVMPAGTPKAIVAKAYDAIAQVLRSQESRDWFAAVGADPGAEPPDVFGAFMREEDLKWGKVIRGAGIKVE